MSGQAIEVVSALTRFTGKAGLPYVRRVRKRSEESCATRQFWSRKVTGGHLEITTKAGNIRGLLTL